MLDHIKTHQAEINKRVRSIYGPSHIQYVEKSEEVDLIKGKSLPIGAISNGYKKIAEGKWRKVSQQAMTKEEHLANSNPKIGGSHVHKKIADTLDDKEYTDDEVMKKPKKEKPAEGTPEHHLGELEKHLKKRFKDPESEEHHDNVEHHLKEYLKKRGVSDKHIDQPFMEDEMFGGGDHSSASQTIKHIKNMAEEMLDDTDVEKGENFNYHGAYDHSQTIKKQIANLFK